MDYRAKELIKQGDALFNKRSAFMNYCQDTAEQFYPERADFTRTIDAGEELASHLTTSAPIIMRRDLGNMFSSMLRPRSLQWFEMSVGDDDEKVPHDAQVWLEEKQATQRNAMYDHISGFQKATKEADHDYVTFGQAPIKVEINYRDQALLIRNRHLRDVAWSDDFTGRTNKVHEKWNPTADQLVNTFAPGKLHREVLKAAEKDPERVFNCRHVMLPVDAYERIKGDDSQLKHIRTKFVSVYVDVENGHVIEESPSATLRWVIPRWQTVSGSQYSYSQAAIAALPDGRLLQAMTLSLLEAGENFANPPRMAVEEALRGDLNLFARGITYVSGKFAEKGYDPIRTISQDKSGLGYGLEMLDRVRGTLREAFFLDKINLPQMEAGVTAYEISQRVEEYIRNAMPLFDPVESEYNAPLCEMIFEEMMAYGFFGQEIPPSLQGNTIRFKFRSPLRDAEERSKAGAFMEGKGLIREAQEMYPDAAAMVDTRKALREALKGISWPTDWLISDEDMDAATAQARETREAQEMIQMVGEGAAAAEQAGKAGLAMKEMAE